MFILFLLNVVAEFERALRVREKHISRDCFRGLRRTMHFSCRMKKIGSESTVGIKMWQVENIYILRTVNAGDINIKHKKIDKNLCSYKQFLRSVLHIFALSPQFTVVLCSLG